MRLLNYQKGNFILPKTKRQWFVIASSILVIALIAQLSITGVRIAVGSPADMSFFNAYLISVLYTSLIVLSQLATGEFLGRVRPVNSVGTASLHIIVQLSAVIVAFLAANQIELLIVDDCILSPENMGVPLAISLLLSFIGNSAFYITYFYRQAKEAQKLVLQSQLTALRAQINPHFLFNTLNSIAALIRINPDEAESVTELLADLFRYSLRSSQKPFVTIEEEIASVHTYLSIEKARFRERLQYSITLPDDLRTVPVPSLLLQPLVENCIKHGASSVEGIFFINVACSTINKNVMIRIEDNGYGFDLTSTEQLFTRGTGLLNVKSRLHLLFPQTSTFTFEEHAIVLCFPRIENVHTPLTNVLDNPIEMASY